MMQVISLSAAVLALLFLIAPVAMVGVFGWQRVRER